MKLSPSQRTLMSMMPVGVYVSINDIHGFTNKEKILDSLVRKGLLRASGGMYIVDKKIEGARHFLPGSDEKQYFSWPAAGSYCRISDAKRAKRERAERKAQQIGKEELYRESKEVSKNNLLCAAWK